jgi:hypothetical protein
MNNIYNKIRRITVGLDMHNQMSYYLGSKHNFFIEKEKVTREIHNILEEEDHYLVYLLAPNNEVQLWKKLPKNNLTTVEYVID